MTRSPFRRQPADYQVRAGASSDEAEILLYDEIGFWGIQAKDFVADLNTITASTIHLRVNSPGGNVFDGIAIHNALRAHPARVITHVDGLAASIASIIALAGDEVHIAANAFFMIHDPWALAIGNAAELRKTADLLDKTAEAALIDTYVRATGESAEQVRAWMHDETWFTATEALEAGFVDAVTGGDADDETADALAALAARFDLSVFAHVPPPITSAAPAVAAGPITPSKRGIERALRDAGLSRAAAKTGAASVVTALTERDAPAGAVLESARRLLAALRLTSLTTHPTPETTQWTRN